MREPSAPRQVTIRGHRFLHVHVTDSQPTKVDVERLPLCPVSIPVVEPGSGEPLYLADVLVYWKRRRLAAPFRWNVRTLDGYVPGGEELTLSVYAAEYESLGLPLRLAAGEAKTFETVTLTRR